MQPLSIRTAAAASAPAARTFFIEGLISWGSGAVDAFRRSGLHRPSAPRCVDMTIVRPVGMTVKTFVTTVRENSNEGSVVLDRERGRNDRGDVAVQAVDELRGRGGPTRSRRGRARRAPRRRSACRRWCARGRRSASPRGAARAWGWHGPRCGGARPPTGRARSSHCAMCARRNARAASGVAGLEVGGAQWAGSRTRW